MTDAIGFRPLRVTRLTWEGEGVISIDLRDPGGAGLTPFTAGAHIDLRLPNGIVRSYSLLNDPREADRYVVGVGLDAASRGGSAWLHRDLRVGQMLDVAGPRNHFALFEDAPLSVLIGGGIGITPICAMARRLTDLGRPFVVHYAVRSPERAAFVGRFAADQLRLHVDSRAGGPLDIAAIVSSHPEGTHFYCCGPGPMLAAFEAATAARDPACIHVEYFAPKAVAAGGVDHPFTVVAQRSGKSVQVAAGSSIVDALEGIGIAVSTSCRDGVCGSCETKVLEGVPDHRDSVLTAAERAAGQTMMVCVSRCQGDRLVLDL